MATYEEIYGKRVKEFDSDPTLDSSYEGQVWYDASTDKLKSIVSSEAWALSTPLITKRSQVAGAGTKTAGLVMGGSPSSSSAPSRTNGNLTEEYNGLGWSSQATCPLYKRQGASFGTQTAAAFFGGYDDPQGYEATLAEYDGSSWTSGGSYPSDISNFGGGAGTLSAGYNAGGYGGSGSPGYLDTTKEYNGSSWSEGGTLPWPAGNVDNLGTQTAGLAAGGNIPPITNNVATYDGTNWTTATSAPVPLGGNGSAGTQTDALIYGASLPSSHSTTTIKFDGSSWTTSSATLGQGRNGGAGCGVSPASTDAFYAGGDVSESTVYGNTEEFNRSINTITAAAWASGGNIGTARGNVVGAGSNTAGLIFGGAPPTTGKTEEYNGTSWAEQTDMGTARYALGGFGTQTAAVAVGGEVPPVNAATEEYNGSSWANGENLPAANSVMASSGPQTAGLLAGGSLSPAASSFDYDGTDYSANPSLSTARAYFDGAGTQTANVVAGGWLSPGNTAATEEYNGSSWTAGGNLATARRSGRLAGTQTATLLSTGVPTPDSTRTDVEGYDGTAWSSRPSTSVSVRDAGRGSVGATSTSAFIAGGDKPSGQNNATEEFTGETETLTAKTLTTS